MKDARYLAKHNVSFRLSVELEERIEKARRVGLLGTESNGLLAKRLFAEHLDKIDGGQPAPEVLSVWILREELIQILRYNPSSFSELADMLERK